MSRILLVDDVAALAEQYRYDVKRLGGHEVSVAASGQEALAFLDYMPIATLFGLGALAFLDSTREARPMEKIAMAGLGGLCFFLGVLLLPPVNQALGLPILLEYVKNFFWFTVKVFFAVYAFIWIRFTFPRYRYDQLMSVGWRWLIPLAIANVIVTGIVMVL